MTFDNWLARPKQMGPNEILNSGISFGTNQNNLHLVIGLPGQTKWGQLV